MFYFTTSVFALMSTMVSSEAFGNDVGAANRYLSQVGFDQVGSSIFGAEPSIGTDQTKFGFAVSLSADGNRLAIGATGHTTANGTIGAVFLYDYNTTDWIPTEYVLGLSTDFPIGEFFDLSADGTRLAVRQGGTNSTDQPVIVYDTATGTQVGSNLPDCEFSGSKAVAVSTDGTQIAVSCENWEGTSASDVISGKNGQVSIYSWTNNAYVRQKTFSGGAADELLGWVASFSSDGQSLAISSVFYNIPNSNNGGIPLQVGQVRVYNTTTWSQIGDDLTGKQHKGRFGMYAALDKSGTTLVVSAPTVDLNGNQYGEVHIYSFNGTNWVPKGDSVTGESQFGKTVAISDDGNRFAATSGSHNANSGKVQVFQWSSTQWNQVHEGIKGLAPGDKFGAGRTNLGLSADGYRIASGSFNAANGRVRVFEYNLDLIPSATPSATVSASASVSTSPSTSAPTAAPSKSIASLVPSNTLVPSSVPSMTHSSIPSKSSAPSSSTESEFPTMIMGKFGWDLDAPLDVSAVFGGDTEEEEIKLSYNISLRTAIITILDGECNTTIGSSIVNATQEIDIISTAHGELNVTLDVKQDTVVGSPIWTDGTKTGEGFINLCVRIDLVLDDADQTSVNFHEQKIVLTIGLSQGFSVVSDLVLVRDEADEEEQDAQVQFDLTSCHCNATADCVSEILNQGDDVYVCVFADPDSDVEIASVDDLDFTQNSTSGSLSIPAIDGGTEDALTNIVYTGKTALIRSQMRSVFFLDSDPDPIAVTGQVSLIFGSVRRTLRIENLLRGSDKVPRKMQELEDGGSAGFKTTLQLLDAQESTSSGEEKAGRLSALPLTVVIVGSVAGAALVAFAFFVLGKKKDDDEEGEEAANGEAICNDLGENA